MTVYYCELTSPSSNSASSSTSTSSPSPSSGSAAPNASAAPLTAFAHRKIVQSIGWSVSSGLQLLSVDIWPFVVPQAPAPKLRPTTHSTQPNAARAGNELGEQWDAVRQHLSTDAGGAAAAEDECMLVLEVANSAHTTFRLYCGADQHSTAATSGQLALITHTPPQHLPGVFIESQCSKRYQTVLYL